MVQCAKSMHGECDVGFLFALTWVGDCKTYFETFCTAVRMPIIQRWRCRHVVRCVVLLPDRMMDLFFFKIQCILVDFV